MILPVLYNKYSGYFSVFYILNPAKWSFSETKKLLNISMMRRIKRSLTNERLV